MRWDVLSYHFHVKIIGVSQESKNIVRKAAYNACDILTNLNTGKRHNFRKNGEVLFEGILRPESAPKSMLDRQTLWMEVDSAERRKDDGQYRVGAQFAREIVITIPYLLTEHQRFDLVIYFVNFCFVREGMIADVCLHPPPPWGDKRNYHAHILLTMREVGPDGFGLKERSWNSKEKLKKWRKKWADFANFYLAINGYKARIDHRSLLDQGIDREPLNYISRKDFALKKRGIETDSGSLRNKLEKHKRYWESCDYAEKEHDLKVKILNIIRGLKSRYHSYEDYLDSSSEYRELVDIHGIDYINTLTEQLGVGRKGGRGRSRIRS